MTLTPCASAPATRSSPAAKPTLFRKLDVAATTTGADAASLAGRLRRAIDTATGGFIDYGEVGGWAAGVDDVLDSLAGVTAAGYAAQVLELAEHAIDRIEAAMEAIDDSNGECGALLDRAREIHLAAARVGQPEPGFLCPAGGRHRRPQETIEWE